jgi:DNA-binding helix-hairpin-helix protein with protein kinase domain
MSPTLRTSRGGSVRLAAEIGRGGEGAVYAVEGQATSVAKLYHDSLAPEKADKLAAMARRSSPALMSFASWPQELLLDRTGKPIGVLLPRVQGEEVHKLYGPVHRKQVFPDADWAFLLHTAVNTAAAFATVHEHGCVIGDVNQGNLLISHNATVSLIDCDSFQFVDSGRVFRCGVGVPHYTPPELQGTNFRHVDRTPNHDAFGLAVVIFQLLAMGRHPFAGRFTGAGDMPIERAISEERFAFARNGSTRQMHPPPHSIPLPALGRALDLFERAFRKGTIRPSAKEWHACLTAMEGQLDKCTIPGHKYVQGAGGCPWCALAASGAPDFFLSIALKGVGSTLRLGPFDLPGYWKLIQGVAAPQLSWTEPQTTRPVGRAVPENAANQRTFLRLSKLLGWCGLVLCLGGLAAWPLAAAGGGLLFAALLMYLLGGRGEELRNERASRKSALANAESAARLARDQLRSIGPQAQSAFHQLRAELAKDRDSYQSLRSEFDREMRQLEGQVVNKQREAFLESFFIDTARISGIGPGRKTVLESYGIETANDITRSAVGRIPGFGPGLTGKLMAWRQSVEQRFRPDPSRGISDTDRRAIVHKYEQLRLSLERRIASGADRLRLLSADGTRRVQGLVNQLQQAEQQVVQARADLSKAG